MERLDQDALTGVVTSGFSERGKQESFEGWFLAVEILFCFVLFSSPQRHLSLLIFKINSKTNYLFSSVRQSWAGRSKVTDKD